MNTAESNPYRRRGVTSDSDWRAFVQPRLQRESTFNAIVDAKIARVRSSGAKENSKSDWASAARVHLRPSFGEMLAQDVLPEHCEAYIDKLLADGLSGSRIHNVAYYFRSTFDLAQKLGAVAVNPWRVLAPGVLPSKKSKDPNRAALEVLNRAQIAAMVYDRRLPFFRRLIYAVSLFAGLRIGEASALPFDCYSGNTEPLGELVIRYSWNCRARQLEPTKTDEVRHVPVVPALARMLEQAKRWHRDAWGEPSRHDLIAPYVPPKRAGERRYWHENTLLRWWRKDLLTVGIAHPASGPRRFHSTRHTFISHLMRAGVDWRMVAGITHRIPSKNPFDKYVHYDWDAFCDAVSHIDITPSMRVGAA